MLRKLHSAGGMMAAALLVVVALSGALLAWLPLQERLHTRVLPAHSISVAALAGRLAAQYPDIGQIRRTPGGALQLAFNDEAQAGEIRIDPLTLAPQEIPEPSPFMQISKNLHRSLLLDDAGRILVMMGALAMLLLALTGLALLARRAGGWRKLLQPVQGHGRQRLHVHLGRLAVAGLLLSSVTGIFLAAVDLEILPAVEEVVPALPAGTPIGAELAIGQFPALQELDLAELRELVYPASDPYFYLVTNQGAGWIDPVSGEWVQFEASTSWQRLNEWIYLLHTGDGGWWWALLSGVSALSVPGLLYSGLSIRWKRKKLAARQESGVDAAAADTLILVGSEGGATRGFARTLQVALTRNGLRVHVCDMNRIADSFPAAQRLLILASTYGEGDAPASANRFLERLASLPPETRLPYAVLGFGDRQFARFCQFALAVDGALSAKGWPCLLPLAMIDRQSAQEFARWGQALGACLQQTLELVHVAEQPDKLRLILAERTDYGAGLDVPVSVFRFAPVRSHLPAFEAGDLVGILPPGTWVPRFYSLASSAQENRVEICVRQHPDGLCSTFLHGLQPGDGIDAFFQPNPRFRPAAGRAPVILVGAGSGIGPLTGFIRHNRQQRPMYLYWGGRDPASGFLYENDLNIYLQDRRLTGLSTAFSRTREQAHVQDRINDDAGDLRELIQKGAQVLVCGGREMAAAVRVAFNQILAPLDCNVQWLQAQGRYREDVF